MSLNLYGTFVYLYYFRIQYTNEQEKFKVWSVESNNSTKLCI